MHLRRLFNGMMSLIVVMAIPVSTYAKPADNQVAPSAIYGARINMSLDQKSTKYSPQYFDPNKIYKISRKTSLNNMPDLTAEQTQVARKVISQLQELNLTKEMIAGILGNLYIESEFKPTALSKTGKYHGLVQWGEGRYDALLTMANPDSAETQCAYLKAELKGTAPATMNYGKETNAYLTRYDNSTMQSVSDVEMACEAFCVVVEGCVAGEGFEGSVAMAKNGKNYQMLDKRIVWAKKFYEYLSSGGEAGSVKGMEGMSNIEMLRTIFGVSSGNNFSEIMRSLGFTDCHSTAQKNRMSKEFLTTGTYISCGQTRTFDVHKYIAEDAMEAIQALSDAMEERGSALDVGGYQFRNIANSTNWSFHASGLAFDCNVPSNPCRTFDGTLTLADVPGLLVNRSTVNNGAETGGIYNPNKDPQSISARAANEMISRGFLWGRDFGGKADMMHFSLGEVSMHGRNKVISEYFDADY